MEIERLESLVGYELPVGEYCIAVSEHERTVGALHRKDYDYEVAHPIYAHLAPHCGMGLTLDEFFKLLDFPLDGGALYGEGDLTYHQAMHVGVKYVVKGQVASVERKKGIRTGIFDLVTLRLELFDVDELVVTSLETYVLPRKNL